MKQALIIVMALILLRASPGLKAQSTTVPLRDNVNSAETVSDQMEAQDEETPVESDASIEAAEIQPRTPLLFTVTAGTSVSSGRVLIVASGNSARELLVQDEAAAETGSKTPLTYSLAQNYPNPFNPATTITFQLEHRSSVTLTVYNTLGQEVTSLLREEPRGEGNNEVRFNAGRLASGVYFYRITAAGLNEEGNPDGNIFTQVKKMTLIK